MEKDQKELFRLITEAIELKLKRMADEIKDDEDEDEVHPLAAEYKAMSKPMQQHVDQGGLEIYPVVNVEPRSIKPRPL